MIDSRLSDAQGSAFADLGKTQLRRVEQYRDRWSSFGSRTGILSLSEKLRPEELRQFEVFEDLSDSFLERLSPDVSVAIWQEGCVLFEAGSYLNLAFVVVEGEVEILMEGAQTGQGPIFDLSRTGLLHVDDLPEATPSGTVLAGSQFQSAQQRSTGSASEITFLAAMDFDLPAESRTVLGAGEIFGEIGALSGWPQSVTARTAQQCRLLQIRLPALRLLRRKSSALRERLDRLYRERSLLSQLQTSSLFGQCSRFFLEALRDIVELVSCAPGEVVVQEGEPADALFMVRSGFVRLAQPFAEGELSVSYLSKGMTLGEVELLVDGVESWQCTASSVENLELVKIPFDAMRNVLSNFPGVQDQLWHSALLRIKEAGYSRRHVGHSEFTQVALDRGLVQGSSILAIDLEQCTRCDDCVRACAATHGGRPRFVREGDRYDNLLVAKSCYHCRDPVCLIGCPTGAIHRAGVGDVVEIDEKVCIGCSTCANNCPYDAIMMHDTGEVWPADMVPEGLRGEQRKVASKCDLCHDTGHGPACVSNCPQACAFRVGSLEEFQQLLSGED